MTTPYTPEQNGTSERMERTEVESAKCMLLNANLPKMYCTDAIHIASYVINHSPTKFLSFKTPEEVWSSEKPKVNHMRTFVCEAMVHLSKEKRKNWDSKAQKMIFIGYCDHTKGYQVMILDTRKVIISRDAIFLVSTVKRDYVPVEISENKSETNKEEMKSELEMDSTTSTYDTILENLFTSDNEYIPDISIDMNSSPVSNITLRPRKKNKNMTNLS